MLEVALARSELDPEIAQIAVENDADRVRAIAVHVDERVKAALGAGKQPVDGPLLVALHMVVVEVPEKILPDVLAQGLLDKGHVLLVMLIAEGHAQKLPEPPHDVVGEPFSVQDGQDIVLVRCKARFRYLGEVLGNCLALVGQDQPGLVQRIAAEHAADRIGEELFHGVGQQERLQLLLALVVAVAVIWVAGEGYFVERHFGCQFILQAVGLNEYAIIFFF